MRRRAFLYSASAALLAAPVARAAAAVPSGYPPSGQRSAYLRSGICCYSYRQALAAGRLTYEQVIDRAVDWALDTVDLTVYWLPRPDRGYHQRLRRHAYRNGIHWSGIAVRTAFTGATAEARAQQLAAAQRWVDFADAMGASHVRIFGGGLPPGWSEAQARPYVAEGMARLAEYSGQRGILLGIENDFGVTRTADQVLHYIRAVNSPWLGANADSFNSPVDSVAQFARLLPHATHIHLKTQIHDAAGHVRPADWSHILTLIQQAGYRGSVSLEYEGKHAQTDVPRYARRLSTMIRADNSRRLLAAASESS
ncbi:MAG: sugar phosphate isomerase/epimerase family protein [Terriglobales bacterium]